MTLLFSAEQYLAQAEAYTRAIGRRVESGLDPYVPSVASVFVSRWDGAMGELPADLHLQLGLLMSRKSYVAYRALLDSDRWQRLLNVGARLQRLLWASTGTKDPKASDVFYIEKLASPFTVNTMPEPTLLAFADHGSVGATLAAAADPADTKMVAAFKARGVDEAELAQRLQVQGVDSFIKAWKSLIGQVEAKRQVGTQGNAIPSNEGRTNEVAGKLDQLSVDTIRTLTMDAVQKANSGHAGGPMGMAPMAYVLWTRYMRHAPSDPSWPNRDRFVLSAGHASGLLYSLLYLTGYDVTLEDLKSFRQWGSKTPGHPEFGRTPGVEATTGPLGQGFANSVGMAIAERRLAAEFNRPGHEVIDHYTYAVCSDGDLQEGIVSEAASLAGHLRLGKLVCLWDDNRIQIDGPTSIASSEDVLARFAAYGWHTQRVEDGNDIEAIGAAIEAARADERPSIIAVRTHIGYGAPTKQDSRKAHSSPLGEEEVRGAKQFYVWDPDKTFYVPDEALALYRAAVPAGKRLVAAWNEKLAAYAKAYPAEAAELKRRLDRRLADGWANDLVVCPAGDGLSSRQASGQAINALAVPLPELFGGAADLADAAVTEVDGGGTFCAEDPSGRNLHFGVREHAMGGIANGIALHGGFIPYVATLLTFSDYMRGSVRLAALSCLQVVYVWTHDSVAVGEDGPTHQPIEHVALLRANPNLDVIRPADRNETAAAWAAALERRDGPTALILSRQVLPTLPGTAERARAGVARGGYVVRDASGNAARPDLVIVATGSELGLAAAAADALEADGIRTRVVSLPCWERFEAQDAAYRESVLPAAARRRVTVEALVTFGWERYAGDEGAIIGLDRYGASAPGEEIMRRFGFTAERVAEVGRRVVREGLHGRVPLPDLGTPAH